MKLLDWVENSGAIRWLTSTEYWYDRMESQSGRSLPVLYREFDLTNASDWRDEGRIVDFLVSTESTGSTVLDFGPGDGWPSLRMAPYVAEVVGVDASARRIEVCTQNAADLAIDNACFVQTDTGGSLPFDDETFDAAVAGSSIEQSPDPFAVLRELWRVLKPGGRLRFCFESLDRYRGERETEGRIREGMTGTTEVEVWLRDLDRERATMARLTLSIDALEAARLLRAEDCWFDPSVLDETVLGELSGSIVDVEGCRLRHPNCRSYLEQLRLTGFSHATATRDGGTAAEQGFHGARRTTIETHDQLRFYLLPIVTHAISQEIPDSEWITAVK